MNYTENAPLPKNKKKKKQLYQEDELKIAGLPENDKSAWAISTWFRREIINFPPLENNGIIEEEEEKKLLCTRVVITILACVQSSVRRGPSTTIKYVL